MIELTESRVQGAILSRGTKRNLTAIASNDITPSLIVR